MAKFNGTAKQARQIQCGRPLRAKQRTTNSAWQAGRKWCLQAKQSVATRQIQHGENVAVLAGKAKMGAVFGRRTSLSRCSHLWHAFGLNLKGFFAHFIVVLFRFIVDFAYFIAISSYLVVSFSYFIVGFSRIFVAFSHLFVVAFRFIIVLTHLFTYKRHFSGLYAFLKFLNALFLGFLCLSLRAIFTRTADFVILSLCKKATQRVARRSRIKAL